MRQFKNEPAKLGKVPLLVGLWGPSGGGKTYSALRLASGIQRIVGGEIFVVDTENRRALHYADQFRFRHVEFSPPFGSLDYLSTIEHCVSWDAKTIVIDSMSHEHEGEGGLLEQHEAELDRMAEDDWKKRERCTFSAWIKPKAARTKLMNAIIRAPANFILCFRAKEKIKPIKGSEPVLLGWMPIAGPEFVYEMTVAALLTPGSRGVPSWNPEGIGEKMMSKLPRQFEQLLSKPHQMSEADGELLARWAAGGEAAKQAHQTEAGPVDLNDIELEEAIEMAPGIEELRNLKPILLRMRELKLVPPARYKQLAKAMSLKKDELETGSTEDVERAAIESQ